MAGGGGFGFGGGGGGVNAWRHGSGEGGRKKRVRGAARPSVGPVHMARKKKKKKKKKRGEGGCKSLPRESCAGGRKRVAIQRMGENKCLILLFFSSPHFVLRSSEDVPLAYVHTL